MGIIPKEQELSQEFFQKMIDKLAEPVLSNVTGIQLQEMNTKEHVRNLSESPFEELAPREQRRSLLKGVDCLRAAFAELKEVVGMRDEDGEPSALDDLLRRVLQHGISDARGGDASTASPLRAP